MPDISDLPNFDEYQTQDTINIAEYVPDPVVNTNKLNRRISRGFGPDQMDEARDVMRLSISERAGLDPFTTTWESLSSTYFKKEVDPLKAAEMFQTRMNMELEEDEFDKYDAMTPEQQQAAAVKHSQRGEYKVPQIPGPGSLYNQPGGLVGQLFGPKKTEEPAKELTPEQMMRAEAEYKKYLFQNSPKRQLAYYERVASPQLKQWADQALLTRKPNMVTLSQLKGADRRNAEDYVRALNPELVKEWPEEVMMRLGRAGRRSLRALGDTVDVLNVQQNPDVDVATYLNMRKHFGKEMKLPDGTPLMTDGEFTSDEARERAVWVTRQARQHKIWHAAGVEKKLEDTLIDRIEAGKQEWSLREAEFKMREAVEVHFKKGGLAKQGIMGAIDMSADMGAAMAAGAVVGPAGAMAYTSSRFYGDFTKDLVFNHGVEFEDAATIAAVATVPYAAIEYLQIQQLKPMAKGYLKGLGKNFGPILKRVIKDRGLTTLKEVGEEGLQAIVEASGKLYAKEYADAQGIEVEQLIKDIGEETWQALISMPFLQMPGGSVDVVRQVRAAHEFQAAPGGAENVDNANKQRELVQGIEFDAPAEELSPEVIQAYRAADTDEERQIVLESAGVADIKGATATAEQEIQIQDTALDLAEVEVQEAETQMADELEAVEVPPAEAFEVQPPKFTKQRAREQAQAESPYGAAIEMLQGGVHPEYIDGKKHKGRTDEYNQIPAGYRGKEGVSQRADQLVQSMMEANDASAAVVGPIMAQSDGDAMKALAAVAEAHKQYVDSSVEQATREQYVELPEPGQRVEEPDVVEFEDEVPFRDEDFADAVDGLPEEQKMEIRETMRTLLGDESAENLKFAAKIIGPDGRQKLGAYRQGWTLINEGRGKPADTVLHEAVHQAEDLFLTPEELAAVTKAEPDAERRAEGFVEYSKTGKAPTGKLREIWDKLLQRIKNILGMSEDQIKQMSDFYDQLAGGKFEQRGRLRDGAKQIDEFRDQTSTPEFQAWFGDSKVTEIVYHSTPYAFTEFDTSLGGGAHFGTEVAADEANREAKEIDYEIEEEDEGFYVEADNGPDAWEYQGPFETKTKAMAFIKTQPKRTPLMAVYLSIQNPKTVEDQGTAPGWERAVEQAKEEGYDGLVYKNEVEDVGELSYVVFSPTQIKSATENVGTFDPTKADIRFRDDTPEVTQERRKAVDIANRMFKGEQIKRTELDAELEKLGLEGRGGEILQAASEVIESMRETVSEAADDAEIMREIQKSEIRRHYRNVIDDIYRKALETGEFQERARAELKATAKRERAQEVRGRTGIDVKDMPIDFPERIDADGFDSASLVADTSEVVRKKLVKEGHFTNRKTKLNNDPIFRRELQVTLAKSLKKAAVKLTYALRREGIMRKIDKLQAATATGLVPNLGSIEKQARQIADDINKGRVRDDVNALREEWDGVLSNPKVKKREKKLLPKHKQELPVQTKRWVNLASQVSRIGQKKRDDLLQSLITFLNSGVEDQKMAQKFAGLHEDFTALKKYRHMTMTEQALMMVRALHKYGNVKGRSPAELREMIDSLQSEIDAGLLEVEEAIEARRKEVEPIRDTLREAIAPPGTKTVQGGRESAEAGLRASYGVRSWFGILPKASTGEVNKAAERELSALLEEWNVASQTEDVGVMHAHTRLFDGIREIYGKEDPADVIKRLKTKSKEMGKRHSNFGRDLSLLDVMNLYSLSTQEDYEGNAEKHERDSAALKKELGPKEIALLDWFRSDYQSARPELSALNEEIVGVPIEMTDPNYTPGRLHRPGGMSEIHESSTVVPSSMNPRVEHKRDFAEDLDILDLWVLRTQENEHYKAWAKLALKLRGVFGESKVQEAMEKALGKKSKDMFMDQLADNMNGGYSQNQSNEGIDALRSVFTFSKFFFNARIGAKQTTSIPAMGFEIGLRKTAKYLGTAFTSDGFASMREIAESDQAKERFGKGHTEELRNALNSMTPSRLQKFFRSSMIFNKLGDMVPSLLIGQGIYRSYTEEYHQSGMPMDQAKDKAMAKVWEIVEATQQSGKLKDQSLWQRRWGTTGKVLSTFTNTTRQFLEQELKAFEMVVANPKDTARWRKLARAAFINHILLPGLYNGMNILLNAIMGDEPDEDDAKLMMASMIAGPASGFIVFGAMISSAVKGLTTGQLGYGNQLTPFAGVLDDAQTFAAILPALYEMDADQLQKVLDKLLKSYLPPYREARKVLDNQ